uniref:Uncharacterized protein n=1 Tax=Arundo donax TaxID=35708 RepID=A0A0A8ZUJ8_ARUDO
MGSRTTKRSGGSMSAAHACKTNQETNEGLSVHGLERWRTKYKHSKR